MSLFLITCEAIPGTNNWSKDTECEEDAMPRKSKGSSPAKKRKRYSNCVRTSRIELSEVGKLSANPDCVLVSKANQEQVKWVHKEGKPFIVFFKKHTPFDDAIFYPGKEDSGPAYSSAKYGTYDYTVKAGKKTLDPQVIIDH
jgi:hypothetical protein